MNTFSNLIQPWLSDRDSDDLIRLRDHLVWLQKELFDEYEPNRYQSFDDRLVEWLRNVEDGDDRKSLFRILEHLFFVGKQQFDALCRAAYDDAASRWIVDKCALEITDPNISTAITELTSYTWFCPITDSMRINSFLKLNGLRGHDHRPDWRSLKEFCDPLRVQDYMTNNSIKRLVLLEDFVGSGDQLKSTIAWAAHSFPTTLILVIPLVCCPRGIETGAALTRAYGNVTYSPTLTLRPELFLTEAAQSDEPEIFGRVRELILRIRARLNGWAGEPFGFEGTGALVALYSNCPDNTLPIIHHKGAEWAPLFSRVRRS